jgi:nitrous oxide reductase accessory protein NosL
MKKYSLLLLLVVSVLSLVGVVYADDDIQNHPSCKYCGMDRGKFAYSRMLVAYEDGTVMGTCSLHCMAVELALNIDRTPRSIHVGDYTTRNLIDAEKAFWVVGGSKPGVMSKRAKWAFENKADAEKYIAENGGTLSTFDEAIKAAYEDMYSDTKMIREKRKMMKKP